MAVGVVGDLWFFDEAAEHCFVSICFLSACFSTQHAPNTHETNWPHATLLLPPLTTNQTKPKPKPIQMTESAARTVAAKQLVKEEAEEAAKQLAKLPKKQRLKEVEERAKKAKEEDEKVRGGV